MGIRAKLSLAFDTSFEGSKHVPKGGVNYLSRKEDRLRQERERQEREQQREQQRREEQEQQNRKRSC